MKKHSRVIFCAAACLAVFIGQSATFAASTNSVWDLTLTSTLSVAGHKGSESNSATAAFLSDGTFGILVGETALSGTYTNTAKSLTLTFSSDSVAMQESNCVDFIHSEVSPDVAVTIKSAKFSKITLSKTGVPGKATEKITGKGTETIGSKSRSKGFTFTDLFAGWTLSSGTAF